jgi:murein DD-endopeptidase MepM/ murein hydrolase activator NlpD
MPVYDDQNEKQSYIDKLRQKRGVDPDVLGKPPQQSQQEKQDDLRALENNQAKINQDLGIGKEKSFTGNADTEKSSSVGAEKLSTIQKLKGFISNNPKKSAGIGVGAGVLITITVLGTIGLGPLKLMQFANLLQGIHFSDGDVISSQRIRNLLIYSKWLSTADSAGIENTRLGTVEAFRAKKIDAKLAESGIKSNFDRTGKFTGFEIDQSKMPASVKEELKGLNSKTDPDNSKRASVYSKHFGVDSNLIDVKGGNVNINAPDGTRSVRKLQYQALKISPNINKATAAYTKRLLYKRANITYNPITKVKQAAKTKFLKKVDEYKEQRQARYSGEDVDFDVPENRAEESDSDTEQDKQNKSGFNASHQEVEDAVQEVNTGDSRSSKISLKGKIAGGGGAAIAIGIICTTQQMSGDIADAQLDNKLKAMIDVGAESVSIDSKIKTGKDIDYETLGFAADSLESTKNASKTDEEGNLIEGESAVPGSAFDASTVLKWQGKDVSSRTLDNPNVADANTDSESTAQQINNIFKTLEETQGLGQSLNAVCGVYNQLDSWMGALVNTLTLGASNKLSALVMGPIFDQLTGDPVNALADKYKGAAFGEMASMGFLLMQNETNSSMGMDILADQQRAELDTYVAQQINSSDSRSFIAKNIDPNNPYGLASRGIISASTFKPSSILSAPKSLFSNISNIGSGRGLADSSYSLSNEDTYGIPKVSIPPALLENPEFENPYKNAIEAKKILATNPDLKKYFAECRGVEISDELDFTTKSFDEGALGTYMKKDCKSEAYMAYSLDNQLLNQSSTNNVASLIRSVFGQKAVAAQTAAPLTAKQKQYATVMFAATDTMIAKSFSCLEFNDDGSCKEIFPEQKVLDECGEESVYIPEGDTSDKLYWPVRNSGAIQSASSHDISVPEGTPVYAAKDGKVIESKDLKGCDGRKCGDGMYSYGRVIKIDHDISGKGPMVYAHLSKRVAKEGDTVKAGQIIGYSGNSGNSYGPHLHIDFNGSYEAVGWLRSKNPELPPKNGSEVTGGANCPEKELAGSAEYTDNTAEPINKGVQVAEQAKKWAQNSPNCEFGPWGTCKNKCLGIVSELWKSVGKPTVVSGNQGEDNAYNAYLYYKKNGWVNENKNIPIGAIMWSAPKEGTKEPGHAYTYVGDGKIASNDIKVVGQYHIVPADWIENKWDHEFLGWSEWHK